MYLGVVFPQTEIGTDPAVIRDLAQAAEALGYHHLLAYDHVLGADVASRQGWLGYTSEDAFHEPFVLFGYLAGCTKRIEFTTGVIILPQRQTALVAKQSAEVDVLSGGRLRLGVGLGWNPVEYEALGLEFRTRGARIADGWLFGGGLPNPFTRAPSRKPHEVVERLRQFAREAGRDLSTLGIEARISLDRGGPEDWRRMAEEWRALGATHLSVATMRAGLATPDDHIEAVRRFREALRD